MVATRDFGLELEPSRLRPGPVIFDILNETGHAQRYSYRVHGRLLARTPNVAPSQTAQLKAMLGGAGDTFNSFSRTSARSTSSNTVYLRVTGPARNGNDDVAQP